MADAFLGTRVGPGALSSPWLPIGWEQPGGMYRSRPMESGAEATTSKLPRGSTKWQLFWSLKEKGGWSRNVERSPQLFSFPLPRSLSCASFCLPRSCFPALSRSLRSLLPLLLPLLLSGRLGFVIFSFASEILIRTVKQKVKVVRIPLRSHMPQVQKTKQPNQYEK